VDLRIVDEREYGAALVYFTGSKDHNIALRNRAIDRDWKLNEYGLFDVGDGDDARGDDESANASRARPRKRSTTHSNSTGSRRSFARTRGELDASAAGELPDLIERSDIRGRSQVHLSTPTDRGPFARMAEAADERDLEYVLLTDHGPHAPIPETLDQGSASIDNERISMRSTPTTTWTSRSSRGIEAEITADGRFRRTGGLRS